MLAFCLRSLRPWRLQIWLGFALLLAQMAAALALIPLAGQLEARLTGFALPDFWIWLGLICTVFAAKNLLEFAYALCFARIAGKWALQLRGQAFARLLAADWQILQRLDPDDLFTRLSDDLDKLRTGAQALLQRLLPGLLLLTALLAVLLLLSWPLTLLLLACAPVSAWTVGRIGRALSQHGERTQQGLSRVNLELNESLRLSRLIRLYRQEARQQARLEQAQQAWLSDFLRTLGWQSLERPLLGTVQVLLIAVLLGFSAWLVARGELTAGELIAYATALALAIDPGLWAAEAWGQIQLARPSWQRFHQILSLATAPEPIFAPSDRGHLGAENVSLSREGRKVLDGLSLRLAQGQRVGLSGPSGSGKSTLLALLAGLEAPDAGRILRPSGWQAEDVLLVPQRAGFFNRSLRENLTLGESIGEAELWEVLQICALAERVDQLPAGLETPLGGRDGWLSGGELQRLALARALLRRPRCLLLDEATSELDIALEAAILERLRQERPQLGWLMVSHRRESLQACEQIWQLEEGKIAHSLCPPNRI